MDQKNQQRDFYSLLLLGQYEDAYKNLKTVSQNDESQSNAELQQWLGTFYFLSGDFEAALAALALGIESSPNRVSMRIKLALVHLELGNYVDMTSALEAALGVDETDAAIYYHRGEIHALGSNMEAATADFARCIQLDPEFILAYVHQARAYLSMECVSVAKEFISKALRLFPDSPELLHSLGECHAMEGNYDESLRLFVKVEHMAPDYPQVLLNKAILTSTLKNTDVDIESELKKIVAKFPCFDAAHVQLAGYYFDAKKTDLANHHYAIAAQHARSFQELVTIFTIQAISNSQAKVSERYPELGTSIQ